MIANVLETGGTLYLYSAYCKNIICLYIKFNSVGSHTQTISSNAANCHRGQHEQICPLRLVPTHTK